MLGAMGGAVAGGMGAHKLGNTGFLGTAAAAIVGGIAGSKLEDFGKEK